MHLILTENKLIIIKNFCFNEELQLVLLKMLTFKCTVTNYQTILDHRFIEEKENFKGTILKENKIFPSFQDNRAR